MAKKRKAAQAQEPSNNVEFDPRESRKRIRTYDDVANSDDDEFHRNQDEIRLGEDPAAKRRRKRVEDEQFLEQSDEEVLGYSDDQDSDVEDNVAGVARGHVASDSEEAEGGQASEDEEEYRWGTSKADLYGTDAIETEEQALEEEAEAIRLQKKQLQQMTAADYGLDDDEWQQPASEDRATDTETDAVVTEVLPQLQLRPDMSSAERLKVLRSRYPEFEPLSKELLKLQNIHESLLLAARKSVITRTKLRAASAYLGSLVMYFSLVTSTASGDENSVALSAQKLHDHPVMESLVKSRELWANVQSLHEEVTELSDVDGSIEDASPGAQPSLASEEQISKSVIGEKKSKKSRAERYVDATREAASRRKAERLQRTEANLADLDIAVTSFRKWPTKTIHKGKTADDESDLGEEAAITAREAADKAAKKKSLRFYTSQIAQKANKRGTAGRNAGGDDDIPHRERLKDRQARLNAEAEKRGKRGEDNPDADLGADSDEEDRLQAQKIRADAEEDDYYDLVAARAAKKKSDKATLAEAHEQASLQGGRVVQEETVGADGKRKISYAIEKNKGLTPHRKKDVRNPRVKKRKKFDEKKKKLASIKAVYKGGEGRGGYGGELTGIKKGLVKSTKLS